MAQDKLDLTIRDELIEIVGREGFSESVIDLISYSRDASQHKHRPTAAVWPTSTEQVSRIMALAYEHELPVIPRGAGTGISGMVVPKGGGLVLDLARMNKIVRISIEDRLAVLQPGVVYQSLQQALAPYGFFFPPDPASGKVATIGGNVATNAGGLKAAKYGVTKDYVLGLEVVLADGRVLRTGSRCMKSVSGYDLTRLFVGSEGTLGVVTEITLKINPKPTAVATGMAAFPTLEDAGRAVSEIMRSGVVPSVCEFMDATTIRLVREYTEVDLPLSEGLIVVECDAATRAEADHQLARVIEVFQANNAHLIREAKNQAEAEAIWTGRRSVSALKTKVAPCQASEDIAVPLSRLPELVRGVAAISAKHNVTIINFGHAGDGNFHPNVMYHADDPEEVAGMHAAVEDIFKLAIELGGTLTGEHGIGLEKAPYIELEHGPVAMGVMNQVKNMFDPKNILNPGKMGLG